MKKIIRLLSFILVVVLIVALLDFSMSTNNSSDSAHIEGYFHETENTIDVLMIGASELYTSFNSPKAWSNYGFTSYCISYGAMPASLYEPILNKALKTQTPKLIVFEINGLLYDDTYYEDFSKLHTWFDNINLDSDDISYMKSLVPEDMYNEFRYPFYKYHSSWKNPSLYATNTLSKTLLLLNGFSYTKSFCSKPEKRATNEIQNRQIIFTEKTQNYLKSLLEFCKNNNCENVLFYRSPHCIKYNNPQKFNEVEALIKSYGYDFLNHNDSCEDIGLDVKNDFYNVDHMNVFGMEKFTKFFGKYIVDNYNVKTSHDRKTVDRWNKCSEITDEVIKECKSNTKGKDSYFELDGFLTQTKFLKKFI